MKLFVFLVAVAIVNCQFLNLLRAKDDIIISKNGDGSKQVVSVGDFSRPITLVFDNEIAAEVSLDGSIISTENKPSKYLEVDLSNNIGQKGVPILIKDKLTGKKTNVLFHESS